MANRLPLALAHTAASLAVPSCQELLDAALSVQPLGTPESPGPEESHMAGRVLGGYHTWLLTASCPPQTRQPRSGSQVLLQPAQQRKGKTPSLTETQLWPCGPAHSTGLPAQPLPAAGGSQLKKAISLPPASLRLGLPPPLVWPTQIRAEHMAVAVGSTHSGWEMRQQQQQYLPAWAKREEGVVPAACGPAAMKWPSSGRVPRQQEAG